LKATMERQEDVAGYAEYRERAFLTRKVGKKDGQIEKGPLQRRKKVPQKKIGTDQTQLESVQENQAERETLAK
jgi:hypothetical protein